jgi:class 3 adenylate cyclase
MTMPPVGTVTLLFTDTEGSTRLWEQHPDAMRTALADHDRLVRRSVEDAGGYIFSSAGDGIAAAFQDARRALQAALDAQARLHEMDGGDVSLRVRMALHSGHPELRDGDYLGPVVNRCARLMAAGHGGQVLVSEATASLLASAVPDDGALRDLGEHRLRDLSEHERIFQLSAPGLNDEFPPLRTLDHVRNNLPTQLTRFVGREQERDTIRRLLRDHRLVTITGVGGGGKTRLALQSAA